MKKSKATIANKSLTILTIVILLISTLAFIGPLSADPTVTVTAATGGEAISADDYVTGAWTNLTGPTINEGLAGEIGLGTIVLTIPTGFEFNPSQNVTATVSPGDIALLSTTATPNATTITFEVTTVSTAVSTIVLSDIQVRPTQGTLPATGEITNTGTAAGPPATGYGTLTEVAGAHAAYTVSAPSTATVSTPFSVTITAVDQFGNTVTGIDATLSAYTFTFSGPHVAPDGTEPTYPTTVNFASGVWSPTVTLECPEITTITVTDNQTLPMSGTSGPIEVQGLVLDADRYRTGVTVTITAAEADWNTRPFVTETMDVEATSTPTGDSITVTLIETGVDTATFVGTFKLIAPDTPGPNDLVVADGDTITVASAIPAYSDTATIDDTEPTVTIADLETTIGTDTTTVLGTFVEAAIDTIYVDGVKATIVGTDFTAVDVPLVYGNNTITVVATDIAGNTGSNTSWIISDTKGPWVTDPTATPPKAIVGGTTLLSVKVTDEFSDVTSVKLNLTSIGGSAEQAMIYNAATELYEYTATVGNVSDGVYFLNITAKDEWLNENATEYIVFEVVTDDIPPVIVSTVVEYPLGKETGRVGDQLNITAVVTDIPAGVFTVEINGSEITGTPDFIPMTRIGTTDAWYALLTVTSGVEDGTYYLNVTATDYAENAASVLVEVGILEAARAYQIALDMGWNLISLPLVPKNSSIEAVLSDVMEYVDAVWSYDAETKTWFSYSPGVPSTLAEMVDGKGYWVNMTTAASLIVYGTELPPPPALPPAYHVVPGWNLIGFKEITTMNASDYLAGVTWVRMYAFYNGAYHIVLPDDLMVPGRSYWIAVTVEGWIYP